MNQFGPEIKGDARSVVSIKYPEFEQDEDDEDESEEDEEDDDEEGDIKLPKIITKEAVLAILKPNVVSEWPELFQVSSLRVDEITSTD